MWEFEKLSDMRQGRGEDLNAAQFINKNKRIQIKKKQGRGIHTSGQKTRLWKLDVTFRLTYYKCVFCFWCEQASLHVHYEESSSLLLHSSQQSITEACRPHSNGSLCFHLRPFTQTSPTFSRVSCDETHERARLV